MIRQAPRLLLRSSLPLRTSPTRRLLSTAPPAQKSRSWKSSAARWGLAIGAIYYYNTSNLFAEEPPFSIPPPQSPTEETSLQTLESISPKRKASPSPPSQSPSTTDSLPPANQGLEATEDEAHPEGAFNEETGEINWDCSCLGGMAHGPCGEQFRAAFSCFVYSKDEPKGMDCIPNFKTMQDCFREYPDVYGAELEDEEGEEGAPATPEGGEIPAAVMTETTESNSATVSPTPSHSLVPSTGGDDTSRAQAAKQQTENINTKAMSEGDELVPKAAHDATSANAGK